MNAIPANAVPALKAQKLAADTASINIGSADVDLIVAGCTNEIDVQNLDDSEDLTALLPACMSGAQTNTGLLSSTDVSGITAIAGIIVGSSIGSLNKREDTLGLADARQFFL